MLGELGCKININDLNEGVERECYPGLLKKTPTSEPLPSHPLLKTVKRKAGAKNRAVKPFK